MTRDDINRLIHDNGLFHGTVKIGVIMDINHLEKFAALVAAAERERLAQPEQEPVCDKDPQGCWNVRCQLGKVCKNTPPRRERN